MLKNMKILAMIALMAIGFASCTEDNKDNPVTPSTGKNYFPSKVGTWWVYNNYERNVDNTPIETVTSVDSIFVSGSETKLGKTAYKYETVNDLLNDVNYFASETGKFYALPSSFLPTGLEFFPMGNIEEKWYLIADDNATAPWEILSLPLANITIPIGTFNVPFTGVLTIKGEKKGMSEIHVGTQVLQTQEFLITYTISGVAKLILDIPVSLDFKSHFYYAENVGLVKQVFDSFKQVLAAAYPLEIPGYESRLQKYYTAP